MANVKGKDNYAVMPQIVGVDIVPSGGTTGQVLTKTAGTSYSYSWQQSPTTAPAGANSNIQYNNAGAFGAVAALSFNSGTSALTLNNTVLTSPVGSFRATIGGVPGFTMYTGTFNVLDIHPAPTNASVFKLYEASNNGSNYITFAAPTNLTANHDIILPQNTATAGQALSVQGVAGQTVTTEWATPAAGSVFGNNYTYVESEGESSTTSNTYQTKVTLTTPSVPAGNYRISVNYTWRHSSASNDQLGRLLQDGSTTIHENRSEGIDTGSLQRWSATMTRRRTLTAGVHTFAMQYATSNSNETFVSQVRMEFWRVS